METATLAAFWAVSFSLVITPGADWAYTIAAGLQRRALAPAFLGMFLGYLAVIVVVAVGVGAAVAQMPMVLAGLTVLGAAYLLWLGLGVLRNPPVPGMDEAQTKGWRGWVLRGFGVSGGNPKVLLLFLALLPQFTTPGSGWPIAGQIAVLGFVHIANCALIYPMVGLGAKVVLRARPVAARRVGQFSGVTMICIALILFAEQLSGGIARV